MARSNGQGIIVRVQRYDPKENSRYLQEINLAVESPLSVMAIMSKVHEADPSFACRTSNCYHGTCGSCWVQVNGRNVKGCMTLVRPGESILLEPDSRYRVLRDLVVDFGSPLGLEEVEGEVEG